MNTLVISYKGIHVYLLGGRFKESWQDVSVCNQNSGDGAAESACIFHSEGILFVFYDGRIEREGPGALIQ